MKITNKNLAKFDLGKIESSNFSSKSKVRKMKKETNKFSNRF